MALRSRIVLGFGEGLDNKAVAERVGCSTNTVSKWRARFLDLGWMVWSASRIWGAQQRSPPNGSRKSLLAMLESTPKNATHWSRAKMPDRSGLLKSTIGRIWKAFELKPHREAGFTLSTDPRFVDKVYYVVGLYLNPPEAAVVYCVDEKSQVQSLVRSQPAFPMMPDMPEKSTHDYMRYGTTSLGVPSLEAPSVGVTPFKSANGTVISSIHRRHRAIEFKKS